jgi:quercetin dioxygenase-like cupin family protein
MSVDQPHPTGGAMQAPPPAIEVVTTVPTPPVPDPSEAMTIRVTLPPGNPGLPPHRHSGPAFGFVIEGAIVFEVEGEPARVVRAGEAFWEPGGDVIHYQDGNYLTDAETRFVVTMFCVPGIPMYVPVSAEELEERRPRRATAGIDGRGDLR